MSDPEVLPGAEPFSAEGGANGVLVLHGFTGCPQSMRGLADAFASAGFTVELPRLPGHGTNIDDMATTTWADWSAAAEATYAELASRCERVVVAGLSMGGSLTLWLAGHHPEIAGIVCINPAVEPADAGMTAMFEELVAGGTTTIPGIGSDIADPDQVELAYDQVPLLAAKSMFDALADLQPLLGRISCPVLLMNAPEDHVVTPGNSDHLAASVAGPVERVSLDRSYHVATLDHDRGLIEERAVAFAHKVCGV
jgi:carboxylesterase